MRRPAVMGMPGPDEPPSRGATSPPAAWPGRFGRPEHETGFEESKCDPGVLRIERVPTRCGLIGHYMRQSGTRSLPRLGVDIAMTATRH